jgi:hypothetical protein
MNYLYDRRLKKYHNTRNQSVVDYVIKNQKLFKFSEPLVSISEKNYGLTAERKQHILFLVCNKSFINISNDENILLWEFINDPHEAFKDLKKFVSKRKINRNKVVIFHCWIMGVEIRCQLKQLDNYVNVLVKDWETIYFNKGNIL